MTKCAFNLYINEINLIKMSPYHLTDQYILVVYSNSKLYDNYRISAAFIGSNKSFYFQPRQKVLWNLNTSGSFKFLSLLWEEHKKETTKGIQQTMNGRKHTKQHDIIFYLMHSTTTKPIQTNAVF